VLFLALTAIGCGQPPPDADGPRDDPNKHGLAFATLPASIRLMGRFEVSVRINDAYGRMIGDSTTFVSIRASGQGTLRGTTEKRAIGGLVFFDDLSYDRWEPITLTLRAAGFADTATRLPVPVRPVMRFVRRLPRQVPVGSAMGTIEIELVDGRGQAVRADQPIVMDLGEDVTVAGGPERNFAAGPVTFPQVTLTRAGARTLTWRSPGLGDLTHGLTVHDGPIIESLWLPAGRVGVPYRARVPGGPAEYRVLRNSLPRGLTLETGGEIHGVPTLAEHAHLEIFAVREDQSAALWKVDLPVFSDADTPAAPGTLDGLDVDGPFAVGSFDERVTVESRGLAVPVRIFHPQGAAGRLLPVVVFHHGAVAPAAATRPTLFDRFDHLLRRWASYGFLVATIDAPELVWADGRLVNSSLSNLNAMSENQRATIAHLRARNGDPAFPLAGRLDVERVIVAGHSRGGGASLITARTEAAVVGGILIKPLDPMATVGGESASNVPLPAKPFLLVIAGADADLPYPMVDFLYERRAGPIVAPTLLGSIHNFTCDASCPPEEGGQAGITREQDWAITNAYAVAFLKYAADRDLGHAPFLFGTQALSTALSPLGVWVRADRGASAVVVDDYQGGTAGRNSLGLPSSDAQMSWSADEPSMITALRMLPAGYDFFRILYGRSEALERSNAHRLEWEQDGARYASALGGLDVRGRGAFVLRARGEGGALDPAQLSLRFTDGDGRAVVVPSAGHVGRTGIGPRFSDVITPLRELRAAGLDLLRLESVELLLQGKGALLVDDLRFE
jgi:dienelactone hydrolase